YTPASHGRLYHAWRLPYVESEAFRDLQTRFNDHLEQEIRSSLTELAAQGGLPGHPCPHESTIFAPNFSESSLGAPAATEEVGRTKEAAGASRPPISAEDGSRDSESSRGSNRAAGEPPSLVEGLCSISKNNEAPCRYSEVPLSHPLELGIRETIEGKVWDEST